MKKSGLLLSLSIVVTIPLIIWGLLSSEAGSRWLMHRILASLPAQTSVASIEGSLLTRISLKQFHYQTVQESVDIKQITLVWQPAQLLSGTLKIADLSLNGMTIVVHQSQPSQSSEFDWNSDLWVPLQLILDNLSITDLHYQEGDTEFKLQYLTISALTEDRQLNIISLAIDLEPFSAKVTGQVQLGSHFPLNLQTHWQINTAEYGSWQAETHIQGNLKQLSFDHHQSSPFKLIVQGDLDELQTQPRINARGDWQQLKWPLAAVTPQINSEQGYFELTGPLDDYQLVVAGPLTQAYLPEAEFSLKAKGNSQTMVIEDLQLQSKAGSLQIAGWLDWQTATTFDLNASGQHFNPGIFLPELPGNLTFDTHLTGELSDATTHLQMDINQFHGQLRGNPVEASGKFALTGKHVEIEQLKLVSGRNRISANGRLDQTQSNLELNIDTPVLASLWPGLGGSLKGAGHIQGNWQNPAVVLQINGNKLQFDDQRIGQLAVDIDYQPETHKNSSLKLNASRIKTGDNEITSLTLLGTGSLEQHRLSLDASSPIASLSTSLTGSLNGNDWQADLSKLTLDSQDIGKWQLKDPAKIQVVRLDTGLDLHLFKTCLNQQLAWLCVSGDYLARGDYSLEFKAVDLPTELMRAYWPAQWQLKGILNAEAEIRQQKGLLTGYYRIDMPANTKVILQDSRELSLGKSSIVGNLKDELLSANADLTLVGSDYVRAKLQLNTAKSQALSGQIKASLSEWALLMPFIPEVSDLKGHLIADFNVQGTRASPVIAGNLNLKDVDIELADAGIGLHDIDLQAMASGGQNNRVQIQAAAHPILIPQSGSTEALQIIGRIDFNADLQQNINQLSGSFRLDIPANTRIDFKTADSSINLPFAASALSGQINGDLIFANLDLNMNNRDFLRAQLEADIGIQKSLSGQINASVLDLALFNALMPELSNIKGQIKADLTVNGTIEHPVANGSIHLSEGSTDISSLGIGLREIDLQLETANADADQLQLSGRLKSGDGVLAINGMTTLKGIADIKLQGTDFEVAKLPEAQIRVSPNLHLALAESGGKISGRLDIPKAIIELQDLPESAVTISKDEIILGQTDSEKKAGLALDLDANIEVELGKQVRFSGQGLDTELSGRLKIAKTGQHTSMHGTIDMKNGRYQRYGQDLTVRKGRFLFNGPIETPWLDVEAIRVSKSQDVTAILSLTGPLKAPKTRIYSEPALPEAEALAYLITGGPLNRVGKADGNMVASAALSYGAGQLSWLTEKLGVDEFEVKQGQTLQDTMVSVGQYLTPDFYVGTKLGLFNKQAVLVLKHNLTKTINLETQSGTSQRVKLNYEINTD